MQSRSCCSDCCFRRTTSSFEDGPLPAILSPKGIVVRKPRVLVVNACNSAEGDINVLLLLLRNLDPGAVDLYIATPPRGTISEQLAGLDHARTFFVEFGSAETAHPQRLRGLPRRIDSALSIARLTSIIHRRNIDLVFSIDRTIATHMGYMSARLARRPFVLLSAFPWYGSSWLNRRVLEGSSRIISHSKYLRSMHGRYIKSLKRIEVIHDVIQMELYDHQKDSSALKGQLQIPNDAPVVSMAGRLSPYKGQQDLIEAARLILQVRPDCHFIIAGRDTTEAIATHGPGATSFRRILEELLETYDLRSSVHLIGYHPDVSDVFAAATVATMPSWEEPFGLVALEAMAMARPVVATRAGGVPEFISHDDTGLLVPPRDPQALAAALLELINDAPRAHRMGLAGRKRVEMHHTAQPFARQVSEIFHTLLTESPAK
jgi:glycosyltransferase involved in cell wall biosynthesis